MSQSPLQSKDGEAFERSCEELERNVDAHNAMVELRAHVNAARLGVLAQPIPRNECPGCFSAIYDGAAKQGWCCDCYPKRSKYEKEAYGY